MPKSKDGKITWPENPSLKQDFSLPETILFYMAKNPPTPEFYNKSIQSCKYFFETLPVLVTTNITNLFYYDALHEYSICSKYEEDHDQKCCINFDIDKLTSMLWPVKDVGLIAERTSICHKIYRCNNIISISLAGADVLYDDLKFLASSAKSVSIMNCDIYLDDETIVMLDTFLDAFPCVNEFRYDIDVSDVDDPSTVISNSALMKIAKLQELKNLYIYEIPNNGIEDFSLIIGYTHLKTWLQFDNNITNEYKSQIDGLIDAILELENLKCLIEYPGQDKKKFLIMKSRYDK
uniref:Uncharacterized protein n=1 Tax=Panagrolaimus sp. ES5 TaxID=591445 RepID=A0AC34F6P9_9BILA